MSSPAPTTAPLRRLARYASSHRRRTWLAVLCSVLNKLFDLAPPVLIGTAVDIVVQRENSLLARLGVVDVRDQLWVLAAVTLAIWVLESLFEYLQKWLWRNLAQTIQHELRVDAYDHVQRLQLAFFEERRTGGLMSILNDDINQLERFLDMGANALIQTLTSTLLIAVVFFALAPAIAWLAMVPIPLVLWGSFAFQRRIAPRYRHVREQAGLVNGQLASNLAGIPTIKSFTTEAHETERIRALSDGYRIANRHAIRLSSAFSPLIRMIIVAGFIVTLVLGGLDTLDGTLAVGSYSVLVFMTQRLLWPLTALGEVADLYQRAMASTHRVMDLLDTPVTIRSGARRLATADVVGRVAFEDVHFAYAGRPPVFAGLNLHIAPNQSVAFVGPTGAGKSTLVKLLLRMYDPQSGRITIDGLPIDGLALDDLRRAVGFVSQDVYLFHGTIAENIAYGSFDASREAIEAAARTAEAHDFITALPAGYDTVVGEWGQRLSGGQRQRLSIARAVLKDPPILILDEATSSVDNETEAAIQRSLERIAVGRVTLVIAHRLSTVRNADRIFVLGHGGLEETGTHDELLARGGVYAGLWRVQTGQRQPGAERPAASASGVR
ncbi:MAG: ABC transporter [Deltaproteobacteria bacterium HGW-Deltaproteobacteria-14]|jgi:ATP-binding cassette subfamily B protein|nr:MAG: ABC transporter [Deltaproteobacteria bacterium HGW-Deltaproteobacteria-14]